MALPKLSTKDRAAARAAIALYRAGVARGYGQHYTPEANALKCVQHIEEFIANESSFDSHFDSAFGDEKAVKEFVLMSLHLDTLYAG